MPPGPIVELFQQLKAAKIVVCPAGLGDYAGECAWWECRAGMVVRDGDDAAASDEVAVTAFGVVPRVAIAAEGAEELPRSNRA